MNLRVFLSAAMTFLLCAPATRAAPEAAKPVATVEAELEKLSMPSLNFENVTLEEGLEYFRQRLPELGWKGPADVKIIDPQGKLANKHIALRLSDVPVTVALRYMLIQCGATARYADRTITIEPGLFTDTRPDERKKADAILAKAREAAFTHIQFPASASRTRLWTRPSPSSARASPIWAFVIPKTRRRFPTS